MTGDSQLATIQGIEHWIVLLAKVVSCLSLPAIGAQRVTAFHPNRVYAFDRFASFCRDGILESRMKNRLMRLLVRMAVIVALVATFTPQLGACSLAACLDHGIEVRMEVEVLVKHEGKPLPGVTVEI